MFPQSKNYPFSVSKGVVSHNLDVTYKKVTKLIKRQ